MNATIKLKDKEFCAIIFTVIGFFCLFYPSFTNFEPVMLAYIAGIVAFVFAVFFILKIKDEEEKKENLIIE